MALPNGSVSARKVRCSGWLRLCYQLLHCLPCHTMHSELLLDRCSAHVSAPLRHQTPEVGEHAVKTIAVICTQ
eukprot:16817-Heterococcus_DN1.PRE.1